LYIKNMKNLSILLFLTLTIFAQEQQQEYKNFTIVQRTGTLAMNIIPGLGSIVIMDDWAGAGIQWALTGAGTMLIIGGVTQDDDWDSFDLKGIFMMVSGIYVLGADVLFNIVRSASYDNPKYVQQVLEKNGNKNFTVGQRFGTFGMNIIPGLGSIIIMDDLNGAIAQWVLVGLGIASIDSIGIVLIGYDILFNLYRSATYNNLKNDGIHLSVLQNRHGKIMPYLAFSKAF